MKKICLLFCLAFSLLPVHAKHIYLEKDYQTAWCMAHNGIMEYKNVDSSRVDCLTSDYAIEFDFANKWAESIGQALYYSIATCKKPAVVLISENGKKDTPYINRLKTVAKYYDITFWIITPSYMKHLGIYPSQRN